MLIDHTNIAGPAEVRELLGSISTTRFAQLRTRSDFPAPFTILAQGPLWDADEIDRWQIARLRPLADLASGEVTPTPQ